MIAVHIIYPKAEGSTYDADYYTATHMPMLADALGDACKGWGASHIDSDEYHGIGWAIVESQEAFDAAMAEHGAAIMGDVPNYTTVAPQLIIGQATIG
jgi:uncharacterized protein (TIGR02118 family)